MFFADLNGCILNGYIITYINILTNTFWPTKPKFIYSLVLQGSLPPPGLEQEKSHRRK